MKTETGRIVCMYVCVCARACFFLSFFLWRCSPTRVIASSFLRILDHTTTHHSRWDSSGRVISSSQRLNNTQYSQQTNIDAPGGIRTQNLSWRADTDLRLRPRVHWDLYIYTHTHIHSSHCSLSCFLRLYNNEHYNFSMLLSLQ